MKNLFPLFIVLFLAACGGSEGAYSEGEKANLLAVVDIENKMDDYKKNTPIQNVDVFKGTRTFNGKTEKMKMNLFHFDTDKFRGYYAVQGQGGDGAQLFGNVMEDGTLVAKISTTGYHEETIIIKPKGEDKYEGLYEEMNVGEGTIALTKVVENYREIKWDF